MEITINPQLRAEIPKLQFGIIQYDNITIGDSPQMLKGRLRLFQESIYFELENKNVNEYKEINEWRTIFKQLGKDPNRYRHSAEALYRRIKKQNYIETLNSGADINNFFSMQYRIPIGLYDRDCIYGPVTLRKGSANETYTGLNGRVNQLEHLLLSADDQGAFGSPFVDSTRTVVTDKTKNGLQIVYLPTDLEKDRAKQLLESLMTMFTQVNGGEATYSIINCF
ncbi:phenylalanine--tRNA ligase beta subunit-related protein [Bacillus sp. FJAT-50079]|uniref:B3/B4 domain-containing protein n=1 Tax=Bacillus sp. FJAT-50079 TaxID=2833577 RepID=UPI001BC8EFB2|nr:phenylalanine--tRNA ligase beta subunit-related protein [Bacillus sp. FJAT-50079]MBS4210836.1 hypothetical protein [Bacillus sp. FJAT-50079]